MQRYVAVDSGKYATKAAMKKADGSFKRVSFQTKYEKKSVEYIFNKDESHTVVFEDTEYLVGHDAQENPASYTTDKKDLLHQITAMTAIGLLVDNGDIVNLAIGCPISIYNNQTLRKEFRDFIAPPMKQIHVTIDGIDKYFAFGKVLVCAESSGILYSHLSEYMNDAVGVIDLGGLNANCSEFNELVPVASKCFTEEFGSKKFLKDTKIAMETALGVHLTDTQMNMLQKDGCLRGKYEGQSRDLFHAKKVEWIENILNTCNQNNWNIGLGVPIIFTGGTSILFKDEIREVAKKRGLEDIIKVDLITENSNFTNVEGFLTYLLLRLNVQLV